MRLRTLMLAGGAVAAAGYYLSRPVEHDAGRRRIHALLTPTLGRRTQSDLPLPENLAPRSSRMASPSMPSGDLSDAEIVQRARMTLHERRDLGADDVVVDVVNGVVYLAGELHDPHTFGEIVDLMHDVGGVRRVQSLLHLPDSETIVKTIARNR